MSVIIRLQNLPWSANSLDIRGFFRGLSIPDGGVHIVGGEQGDAFIAFSTDEDARQAMMLDGGKIKEVGVRLLLSSRAEMQKVIETARKTTIPFMQLPAPQPPVTSSPLSGLLTQQMLQQQLQQQTNLENFMNKPPPVFPDSNLQMSFGQNQQINQLTPTQEQTIQLPLLSTPIIVKDNSNDSKDALSNVKNDSSNEGKSDNKNNKMRNYDRRDKRSRSRSKSRSRSRDRRRSRSRDRGNSRRRRDRSRSRDRRDRKKRDNRSRSRERSRDRSYDRERSKDKEKNRSDYGRNERRLSKDDFPQNKISTSQIWDIPLNSMLQNQQLNINRQTNVSNSIQPFVGSFIQGNTNTSSSLSTEEIVNLHKLNEKRNQNAFQSGISVDNNLFQTLNSSSTFKSNFDDQLKYDKQDNKTIDVAGRCVKISNMDTITGYGDIRRFFFGLHISINGIRMINDQTGRRTGSACVQFMREESKRFALERDGMRLRNQTVTVTSIADDDYDNAVDSFRPTYESDDDVTIVSSEQISEKTVQHAEKSFTTLQVEDLPPFAKEQDIMKMFSNYTLLHIVIVREKDNSRRYMAYVKFHRAEDAKAALGEISNHLIAHKKVHVSVCDEIVYEAARQEYAEYLPSNSDVTEKSDTSTTSERSKPFSSTRWDGADQSKNSDQNSFNNLQEKIIQLNTLPKLLEMYSKPRQTNCPDPRHVLRSDPRQELRSDPRTEDKTEVHGDPRIFNKINDLVSNLITGTQQFQNRVSMDPRFNSNRMLEPKQLNSEISDCVVISNLESKTTNRDVIDFFSDIGIVPRSVHILLDKSGQPSGDCFCEFITPEDATRALTKNSCHLGMNQVNVESIPREKVDDILSSFKDLPLPSDNMQDRNELMSLTNQPFGMRNNYQMRCGRMTGLRFGNIGPPNRSSLGNNGNRQPFMRPNMPISMMGMGPNLINQNENGPGSMPLNNGCVISMENVPYRAGVQDILEFFSDFDLKAQNIMRRFNDSGKPTGDARVLFSSQIEAKRAVDIKNHQKIQGRTIYLNIVGMIE